jgi:hypothetical protein
MSGTNTISSISNLLLVLCLLACILSSSVSSFYSTDSSHKSIVSRKSDTPSHSDFQIPYQEREKEERESDESSENGKVLVFLTVESILFTISETESYAPFKRSSVSKHAIGVPLYLTFRRLLR